MRSGLGALLLAAALLALSSSAIPQASKDMVDVKGAQELRELFTNKTHKGSTWIAYYRSDGKGQFVQSSRRPEPRTWTIKGDDQVCISTIGANYTSSHCWRFQRHKQNTAWITQTDVSTGGAYMITVEDGIPKF
jgi:hypothetical protein